MSNFNRWNWDFSNFGITSSNILKDKKMLINSYIKNMINRTMQMFDWQGLPDTIPKKDLEQLLQLTGSATIAQAPQGIFAFRSGLGGVPNAYYLPTISIVANPALNFNKELVIDKDCVVMLNDSTYNGLTSINAKFASLLAELDITIRYTIINARLPYLIKTNTVDEADNAKEILKDIEDGVKLGFIADSWSDLSFTTYPYFSNLQINELIELYQYLKSQWYQELGLNSNYNMKRESLNQYEISSDTNILTPLVQDMLEQREIACDKINTMFGLNVSVKLAGAWDTVQQEEELSIEQYENGGEDDGSTDDESSEDDGESLRPGD